MTTSGICKLLVPWATATAGYTCPLCKGKAVVLARDKHKFWTLPQT